jgi:hypothetical protein
MHDAKKWMSCNFANTASRAAQTAISPLNFICFTATIKGGYCNVSLPENQ